MLSQLSKDFVINELSDIILRYIIFSKYIHFVIPVYNTCTLL